MPVASLVTAETLERMGSAGRRFELVRGTLVPVNPANAEHGRIAVLIAARLLAFADSRGLGTVMVETGYKLGRGPDTVRGPDVSFVRAGRTGFPPHAGFVEGAPDLAVEVRSPDDTLSSVLVKAEEYLAAGARLVWIVEARAARVHVFRAGEPTLIVDRTGALDGADVLPGFRLELRELFTRDGVELRR